MPAATATKSSSEKARHIDAAKSAPRRRWSIGLQAQTVYNGCDRHETGVWRRTLHSPESFIPATMEPSVFKPDCAIRQRQ